MPGVQCEMDLADAMEFVDKLVKHGILGFSMHRFPPGRPMSLLGEINDLATAAASRWRRTWTLHGGAMKSACTAISIMTIRER